VAAAKKKTPTEAALLFAEGGHWLTALCYGRQDKQAVRRMASIFAKIALGAGLLFWMFLVMGGTKWPRDAILAIAIALGAAIALHYLAP
jgi:hypothetical protein